MEKGRIRRVLITFGLVIVFAAGAIAKDKHALRRSQGTETRPEVKENQNFPENGRHVIMQHIGEEKDEEPTPKISPKFMMKSKKDKETKEMKILEEKKDKSECLSGKGHECHFHLSHGCHLMTLLGCPSGDSCPLSFKICNLQTVCCEQSTPKPEPNSAPSFREPAEPKDEKPDDSVKYGAVQGRAFANKGKQGLKPGSQRMDSESQEGLKAPGKNLDDISDGSPENDLSAYGSEGEEGTAGEEETTEEDDGGVSPEEGDKNVEDDGEGQEDAGQDEDSGDPIREDDDDSEDVSPRPGYEADEEDADDSDNIESDSSTKGSGKHTQNPKGVHTGLGEDDEDSSEVNEDNGPAKGIPPARRRPGGEGKNNLDNQESDYSPKGSSKHTQNPKGVHTGLGEDDEDSSEVNEDNGPAKGIPPARRRPGGEGKNNLDNQESDYSAKGKHPVNPKGDLTEPEGTVPGSNQDSAEGKGLATQSLTEDDGADSTTNEETAPPSEGETCKLCIPEATCRMLRIPVGCLPCGSSPCGSNVIFIPATCVTSKSCPPGYVAVKCDSAPS